MDQQFQDGQHSIGKFRILVTTAPRPVRLVGVEMAPRHFGYMSEHLTNNGIDPRQHRLLSKRELCTYLRRSPIDC